jgi:hypothetical protein
MSQISDTGVLYRKLEVELDYGLRAVFFEMNL